MGERTRPRPLPESEIRRKLASLPSWSIEGRCIARDFRFPGFAGAVRFVNEVARQAERMGHHPDVLLSYRSVTVRITSHDAGGITDRDLGLAEAIDASLKQEQ